MRFEQLKIFTGNANPSLAAKICASLGCTLGAAEVEPFSDGEIRLQILENVRGADVFAVQPTCTPVDRHLMELLLMIDALKRASAERITAVLPYYGYARQDRKDKPRMPISARLIANLIQRAGADRVLTLDLHAAQIQGFFDVPVDHLFAAPVMLEYFESIGRRDMTVVSPDAGGVERARAFAKHLNAPLAIIDKRRRRASEVAEMQLVGEVQDSIALLVDDMVDTAGTITEAAKVILAAGASEVWACATHPILSDPACDRLSKSPIKELVATNSIPLRTKAQGELPNLTILSVAGLIAEAIRRIHNEESVSSLFS